MLSQRFLITNEVLDLYTASNRAINRSLLASQQGGSSATVN